MTNPAPDVYGFSSAHRFLLVWLDWKRASVGDGFTQGQLARKAGMLSGTLSNIVRGTKKIGAAAAGRLGGAMRLGSDEIAFFELLARMERARDHRLRSRLVGQIFSHPRFRRMQVLDGAHLDYLRRWYYPVLRELAAMEGFDATPSAIRRSLNGLVSEEEAREALAHLVDWGYLVADGGRYNAPSMELATVSEPTSLATLEFHQQTLELARRRLVEVPQPDRHYVGGVLAFPPDLLPTVKLALDQLSQQIQKLVDAEGERPAGDVYMMGIQLFPVAHLRGGET